MSVCEDIWQNDNSYMRYHVNPLEHLHQQGAEIMVNISASPFTRGKINERADMLARRCKEFQSPLLYVNQVGAQTELIFDGDSFITHPSKGIIAQMPKFKQSLIFVTVLGRLISTRFVQLKNTLLPIVDKMESFGRIMVWSDLQ